MAGIALFICRSQRVMRISKRSRGYCWKMNPLLPPHLARTMFGASLMHRRSRSNSESIAAASSFSCSMGWPDQSSARWWKWVIASANIAPSANSFPECPTSSAACSRTPQMKDFCVQNFPRTPLQKNCCAIRAKFCAEAERAVAAARAAFEKWGRTSFEERCQMLERAAEILERRRFELSALEVFEVGKPWAEADGDIREAIDFCTFYARQMRLIGRPRLTQIVPGEDSYHHYWPRGVALVIAPWNFPMAILCGMVRAALVTGT